MDVDNASGESATFPCGHSGAKPTSMPETRCYQRVLDCAGIQSSALFRDAELVDNPKEAKTFWLPADASPTTSLELLVKAIFDFHTEYRDPQHPCPAAEKSKTWRDNDGNPDIAAASHPSGAECGAEWWVQRREEGHHENLGMPFHWDKDEHMLDQKGEVICPAVSTVTYLTAHGAPTVVLECRVSEKGVVEHGNIKRAFVSYPALFKHLSFDGGFLHGVPQELMRTEEKGEGDAPSNGQPDEGSTCHHSRSSAATSPSRRKRGRMRVTLLVNVWLFHKPEGVAPLPADLAVSLSSRSASASPLLCFDRPVDFFPLSVGKQNEALVKRHEVGGVSEGEAKGSTMVINAPLGPTISVELRVPTPGSLSVGRLKALHSFALLYREGSLSCVTTRSGGGAGGLARVESSTIEVGFTNEERAERGGGGLLERNVGREVDKVA